MVVKDWGLGTNRISQSHIIFTSLIRKEPFWCEFLGFQDACLEIVLEYPLCYFSSSANGHKLMNRMTLSPFDWAGGLVYFAE